MMPMTPSVLCSPSDIVQQRYITPPLQSHCQSKIKGQQLKGKLVSELVTLSHTFSPRTFPFKQRAWAQGEQKRRKDNKKNRTNRCCTLVVARLSSSYIDESVLFHRARKNRVFFGKGAIRASTSPKWCDTPPWYHRLQKHCIHKESFSEFFLLPAYNYNYRKTSRMK